MTVETGFAAMARRDDAAVRDVARRRTKVSLILAALLIAIYLGFVFLAAFAKTLLATPLSDGISLALVVAALVIVAAWVLAWVYVSWARRHHDAACDRLS